MALRIHPTPNYGINRSDAIFGAEGIRTYAYVDTQGIGTIGFGLNLRVHGWLVLEALGFDVREARLTGAALAAERAYLSQLNQLFQQALPPDNTRNNSALAQLNQILVRRANDPAYAGVSGFLRINSFEFATAADAEQLSQSIFDSSYSFPASALQGRPQPYSFTAYEVQLDRRLPPNSVLAAHDSFERIALVSMVYNGGIGLIGPGLQTALANENRAEAWFQIRYRTNAEHDASGNPITPATRQGIANRRYNEADLFGLYNASPALADYVSAYRMYTRHRNDTIYGQPGGLSGYEALFDPTNPNAQQQRISQELEPARAALGSQYGMSNVAWDHIFVGGSTEAGIAYGSASDAGNSLQGTNEADLILGLSGNDDLRGLDGNDVLVGGTGNDTLSGGAGNDVYVFRGEPGEPSVTGDGEDTITDYDGIGSIRVGATLLSGLEARSVIHTVFAERPAWQWTVEGRTFDFVLIDGDLQSGGTLWIEGDAVGLGDRITIENFHQGDLGLFFPVNPLLQFLPGTPGIQGPFADANFEPTTLSTTLREGEGRTLTLAFNTPAQAGQAVRLSVDQLGDELAIVTGSQTLSLGDGYVDLTLSEGQTQLTFTLFSQGNVNIDTSLELTAALLDAQGNVQGSPADAAIAFDTIDEGSSPTAFPNFRFGTEGDDNFHNSTTTEYIEGAPLQVQTYGGNDLVIYDFRGRPPAAAVFDVGDGHDELNLANAQNWVNGGAGNDLLWVWGDNLITGGAGSDVIFTSDFEMGVPTGDRVYGEQEIELSLAIGQGETAEGTSAVGDLLSSPGEAATDLLVGTQARDVLAGGGGSDTLVSGAGDDLVLGDHYIYIEWAMTVWDWPTFQWDWHTNATPGPGGATVYSYELTNYVEYGWSDGNGNPLSSTGNLHEAILPGAADTIYAGAGNDLVLADDGDDFVDAGSGDDVVFGGIGGDTLLGYAGNDVLDGGDADDVAGADFIDGGDGNDKVWGGNGADALYGGAGADEIVGDDGGELGGNDYLNGEEGDDDLFGGARNDRLIGGEGADTAYGDSSADAIELQGDDYLDGGAGDDTLVGGGGDDHVVGGGESDHLYGDSGGTPNEATGDDYLDGGAGDDTLVGGGGSDILFGGDGADTIDGDEGGVPAAFHGDDRLDGGDGNDVLIGSGGSDTLFGGAGNDQLFGDVTGIAAADMGDDYLSGGIGDDTLSGYGGNDALDGDDGVDVLAGGDGDDELNGGEGNDSLVGDAGNDVLCGGAGVDVMNGGAGNDIYVFDAADLQVQGTTADGIIDTAGSNVVIFNDLASSSFTLLQGAQSGSINFVADGGALGLVVRGALAGSVATFQFADTTMSSAELIGRLYDANADQTSDAAGAMLIGGSRADTISGYGDGTTVSGGLGNDLLVGGDGSTTYRFERGDGVGTVTDASTFTATGGLNRNVLELGQTIASTDVSLALNAGSTQLRVDLGSGDALQLTQAIVPGDVINGPRTLDEIRFAEGTAYTWQEFLATRRIVITNTDNQASYQGTNSNDEIRGAELAETIDAGTGDDILAASGGNDTLIGGAGSDTYVFARGTGADAIVNTGADANSIDRLLIDPEVARGEVNFYRIADSLLVRIGTTSDQVFVSDFFGSAGLDQIAFADGTIYTAADVPLQTLPQNQLTYSRGEGNRTFVINDPSDSIFDRLQFGANVDPQSVVVGSDFQGNLVISFRNANGSFDESDTVVVTGGVTNAAARLNQVTFAADATIVWSDAEIRRRSTLPTEDGDYIYGTSGADTFEGLDGRDTIYGYAGDDVLDGGSYGDWLYGGDGNDLLIGDDSSDELRGETGNDVLVAESGEGTLLGGAGSDTYVVGRGVGNPLQLILNDFDIAAESIDVLKFAAGIAPGDIRFVRSGNNLRIDVVDRTRLNNEINNQVTITNYFSNTNRVIDEVRFTDDPAVVWRLADVQALALVGDGFNDILDGTTSAEMLRGNGGDDLLNALGGNDDLDGGTGRDQLNGGDGDDVYRFGPGAGSDEVFDTSGTDRIELAAGIAPVDVSLFRVSSRGVIGATLPSLSDALVIHVNGTREQLLIENFFAADASARIEEIRFSDGTVWDSAAIAALVVDQSGIQNTQTGGSTDDAFAVDHSGDTIVEASGGGTDTVSASVSYVLPANVENLTLLGPLNLGGTGNVLSNTIIGTSGDNVLNGASGADTLIGGAGDDIYYVDQVGTSSWSSNYFNFQDTVVEQADDGSDTIIATTYSATLPANIERLILGFTLTGASSFPNGADLSQRFTGNALDNYIDASVASPYFGAPVMIDGGAGADVMIGNARANVYVIDNPGDVIVESWGGNDDRVESYIDYTLDERIENLTLLGSGSLSGTGNALRNVIIGNTAANVLNGADGNDTLNGGVGADTLIGGRGDDLYTVDNTGDIVLEGADEGSDTIESSISYTLGSNVERLLLAGAGWVGATGNELDNFIGGNDGNNILDGRGGNDQLNGGSGQDRYVGVGLSSGADTIFDFLGYDTLELDPGIRIDQLQFSMNGNDLRIDVAPNSSVTIESWISPDFRVDALITTVDGLSYTYLSTQMDARAQGIDSAPVASAGVPDQSIMAGEALSFQFAANVFTDIESQQSLVYSADLLDGSALPSWLSFDATTRTFSGLPGNAEIGGLTVRVTATDSGGLSASTQFALNVTRRIINGTAAADILIGDVGDEIINGLQGDDTLQGLAGADELYGNEGDDTLDGGSGSDLMIGGSGNDIYTVDDIGDALFENPFDGTDEVRSSITYTLTSSSNLENLTLVGTSAINGTGDSFDNVLIGNGASNALSGGSGNDTLDGGGANDSMSGGQGNDVYFVDHPMDATNETSGQGTDTVKAPLNWTLASNVENLVLLGTGNFSGTGNSSANQITGNSGDNALNGMGGADTMIGGGGNDTYTVDVAGDIVTENPNEGVDLVRAGISYTLGADVENLTLTGSSNFTGTGNGLDNALTGNSGGNTLTGNAGNDTLDGGSGGTDSLVGGIGDDTYIVARTTGITITENAGEGSDTVRASVTYTLGGALENLTLTGSSALNGTGNALDNVLTGNDGNNTLTGSGGSDTLNGGSLGTDSLLGGTGNDIYIVGRTSGITVTENASEGTDTVQASVNYTLGNNVENLTLTGTSAVNGTGNTLANVLVGNGGDNTLTGGAGNDTLTGGDGADIYSYSSGHGSDTIDNSSTDSAQDRLNVTNLTRSHVTFTQSGNDLVMTRNGTPTDSVRVTNWFTVPGNQLDFVQFTDQTLTSAQINSLFGGGLMSAAESIAPPQRVSDRWDRSFALFVDAMNHFGRPRDSITDHFGAVDRGADVDWLAAGSAEMDTGTRAHGGGHGDKRQLV